MQLSCRISELGRGINGRRAAQILFYQLTQAGVELGTGANALNYLPARSMRAKEAVELIKGCQKVIYMLKLALRQKIFTAKETNAALECAVDIANSVTEVVMQYSPKNVPVQLPSAGRSAGAGQPAADEDGFNAIYNGKI